MKVLKSLLEDGNVAPFLLKVPDLNTFAAKLRASIAAKLGKTLGSFLPTTEYTDRAVTVLTTITAPPSAEAEGSTLPSCIFGTLLIVCKGTSTENELHQLWIQIILLLSRNGSNHWIVHAPRKLTVF